MRNIFQSLYENVCFFPVQWSVHARSPDSVARGYQSMQSRWKSEYIISNYVSVFLFRKGMLWIKAVIRRRGGRGKKLTLSMLFSPVSRKHGPQRNSANAFWMYTPMYPTERRSFTIAFSSQSISWRFVPSANISLLGMSH